MRGDVRSSKASLDAQAPCSAIFAFSLASLFSRSPPSRTRKSHLTQALLTPPRRSAFVKSPSRPLAPWRCYRPEQPSPCTRVRMAGAEPQLRAGPATCWRSSSPQISHVPPRRQQAAVTSTPTACGYHHPRTHLMASHHLEQRRSVVTERTASANTDRAHVPGMGAWRGGSRRHSGPLPRVERTAIHRPIS